MNIHITLKHSSFYEMRVRASLRGHYTAHFHSIHRENQHKMTQRWTRFEKPREEYPIIQIDHRKPIMCPFIVHSSTLSCLTGDTRDNTFVALAIKY